MKGFVSSRNFIGGFCGGFVGLLLVKLFWPALLSIGCFVGFTLGYARRELLAALKGALRWSAAQCGSGFAALGDRLQRRVACIRSFYSALRVRFALFKERMHRFGTETRRFALWLGQYLHPVMPAYTLRLGAVLLFMWLNHLWYTPLLAAQENVANANGLLVFSFLVTLFLVLLVIGMPTHLYLFWSRPDSYQGHGIGERYAEKERREWRIRLYREHGGLYFFARDFLGLCGAQLLTLLLVTSFVLYGIVGGGLLLFAGVLPFMIAVMCVRVICSSSRSGEYWIGLGATLIVTALSAWLNYARLNGSWLWIIALLTGCVAGVSAEALRRLVVAAIDRWPQIEAFSRQPLKDHLRPIGAGYWRIGKKIFATQWSLKTTLVPES